MTFDFETAALTHIGNVRKLNEDSILAEPERGLWLVADGMGGHRDGALASSMITKSAQILSGGGGIATQLSDQLAQVNQNLLSLSNGNHNNIIGSTVVALVADQANYTCIWAGDSRCYLVRGGQLKQISRDHTEVQELIASGVLSEEEGRNWPRRNVITRAVGAGQFLELEQVEGKIEAGDCFILCSDGLTGHVNDSEILSSVDATPATAACHHLLELALQRGGKDNISIIVVNVSNVDKTQILQRASG